MLSYPTIPPRGSLAGNPTDGPEPLGRPIRSRRRRDLDQVRELGDRAAEHPALDAETGPLAWKRPGGFDTIHGPIGHGMLMAMPSLRRFAQQNRALRTNSGVRTERPDRSSLVEALAGWGVALEHDEGVIEPVPADATGSWAEALEAGRVLQSTQPHHGTPLPR